MNDDTVAVTVSLPKLHAWALTTLAESNHRTEGEIVSMLLTRATRTEARNAVISKQTEYEAADRMAQVLMDAAGLR